MKRRLVQKDLITVDMLDNVRLLKDKPDGRHVAASFNFVLHLL